MLSQNTAWGNTSPNSKQLQKLQVHRCPPPTLPADKLLSLPSSMHQEISPTFDESIFVAMSHLPGLAGSSQGGRFLSWSSCWFIKTQDEVWNESRLK